MDIQMDLCAPVGSVPAGIWVKNRSQSILGVRSYVTLSAISSVQ